MADKESSLFEREPARTVSTHSPSDITIGELQEFNNRLVIFNIPSLVVN